MLIAATVAAQTAPLTIPFTGAVETPKEVREAGGGIFPFRFEIYDASNYGRLLFQEEQRVVVVGDHFSAIIGQTKAIPSSALRNPESLWFQIWVDFNENGYGPEDQIRPRIYLAPYLPKSATEDRTDRSDSTGRASSDRIKSGRRMPSKESDSAIPLALPPEYEEVTARPAVTPPPPKKPAKEDLPKGPKGDKGDKGDKGEPGTAGPAGPMGPPGESRPPFPIPLAPIELSLRPSAQSPGSMTLRWYQRPIPGLAGFSVYQSPSPIAEDQKGRARRTPTGATNLSVEVAYGGAPAFFRVAAMNLDGIEGPLSAQIAVDPASRLIFALDAGKGNTALLVKSGSDARPSQVALAPLVPGERAFQISPESGAIALVAFDSKAAKQRKLLWLDLQKAFVGGENPSIALAGPVGDFGWLGCGGRVAYIADAGQNDTLTIDVLAPGQDPAPSRVTSPLGGNAVGLQTSSSGRCISVALDGAGGTKPGVKVVAMPRTGGAPESTLATEGKVLQMAWAPARDALAFRLAPGDPKAVYRGEALSSLFVLDLDTATSIGEAKAIPLAQRVTGFAWSPEGGRIAFSAIGESGAFPSVFVAAPGAGGAAFRRIYARENVNISSLAWSPDGTRVALRAEEGAPRRDVLYMVDATGWGYSRLSPDPKRAVKIGADLAWSPDGRRLAYRSDQETEGSMDMFVTTISGSPAVRVNDKNDLFGGVVKFAWSPDGSRLAFLAATSGVGVSELFVTDAQGGGAVKVNDPLPLLASVLDFAWSPWGIAPAPSGWSLAASRPSPEGN